MLLRINKYSDLDERKLMDIYAESNFENTDFFFPDISDKNEATRKVEAGFLDYLKNVFFSREGNDLWVLEEDGLWVSALRTSKLECGIYYPEALETRPDSRRKGYAAKLLSGVLEVLKPEGPFRMYDCVSKKNTASLKTHEKCGFRIVSEKGFDYLTGEYDEHCYGLEYCHD